MHYLYVSFKDWKRRLGNGVEKRAIRYLAAELLSSVLAMTVHVK